MNQEIRERTLSGLSLELIEAQQWDHAEKVAYSIQASDERALVLRAYPNNPPECDRIDREWQGGLEPS